MEAGLMVKRGERNWSVGKEEIGEGVGKAVLWEI
jgi:hypothetical protein